MTISGVSFTIVEARVQDTYPLIGMEYKAENPDDQVLAVRAEVSSGDPQIAGNWTTNRQVWITDEGMRVEYARMSLQGTVFGKENQILWLFPVNPQSEAFLLWLPQENQVFLLPLMHPELVAPPPDATLAATGMPIVSPVVPASPTVMASPSGTAGLEQANSLLLEDFSDNSHSWSPRFDQTVMSVADQRLSVESVRQDYVGLAYCSVECGPFKDEYYLQADLGIDHDSDLAAGIVFGLSTHIDAYYVFMVSFRSGTFALFKRDPQEFVTLVDWDTSQAISPFPASNTLAVYYSGGKIELYINSQEVGEYTDNFPYNAGMIGIYAGNKGITVHSTKVMVLADKP